MSVVCSAFGVCLYALFGHSLIKAIYEGKSLFFLNPLIVGQQNFPLLVYLETGDAALFAVMVIGISGLFFLFLINNEDALSNNQRWLAGGFFSFLIVVGTHFLPKFSENEFVYLIFPKRLLSPGFLAYDWTWRGGQYEHFVFDVCLSPFTMIVDDLSLALAGRLVLWVALIWAMVRIAVTLQMKWW